MAIYTVNAVVFPMSSIWRINSSISHAVFRSYSADPCEQQWQLVSEILLNELFETEYILHFFAGNTELS
ncbi:hypothetical protein T4B_740 [Trichinella pseudospiralis]|uniref:Uncharacterized protein n=1 Tax=Trichinella pseudospiralis TaxID=6337 RepID=A0A0V1H0R6_TRIPS|nr:hypothetical protein T4B_6682 [Trichinella pseudospiralis]KRZ04095.1 hypothetical protein T4B_1002 [Trichinella pseudospiralis]KRZ04097.1 hypothetical protein T4B_740 [Trichinella pseudospiralis]